MENPIKALMRERGLTRTDMAKLSGFSVSAVRIAEGSALVKLSKRWKKACDLLGVDYGAMRQAYTAYLDHQISQTIARCRAQEEGKNGIV